LKPEGATRMVKVMIVSIMYLFLIGKRHKAVSIPSH
jgi:hypothetical protein